MEHRRLRVAAAEQRPSSTSLSPDQAGHRRALLEPLLVIARTLATGLAVASCLTPWERVQVDVAGLGRQVTVVGVLHGSAVAAVVGGSLALLTYGHRLGRPQPSGWRDAATATAATLLLVAAALFTSTGGFPPRQGDGYLVDLGPAVLLSALGGAALLGVAVVESRYPPLGERPVTRE